MLATSLFGERSIAADEAIALARRFLSARDYEVQLSQVGSAQRTTHCILSAAGQPVSRGTGKGIGDQSIASALYEAIEHLYSVVAKPPVSMPVLQLDLDGSDSPLDGGSPDYRKIIGGRPAFFSRVPLKDLRGQAPDLQAPYFLWDPEFRPADPREEQTLRAFALRRYSTNSGIASGACASDAILHGLLELIERDAVGVELIRTVIARPAAPVRRIDRDSVGKDLLRLLCSIESETDASVDLWDITTPEISVPVILAAIRTRDNRHYFGSGASLSSDYAAERAALESLQYFHAHKIGSVQGPTVATAADRALPAYARSYLQRGLFAFGGGAVRVSLPSSRVPQAFASRTSERQVAYVIDRLATAGMTAYARSILDDTVCVYQIAVPRLERFHLVSYGVPVLLGARGRRILDACAQDSLLTS